MNKGLVNNRLQTEMHSSLKAGLADYADRSIMWSNRAVCRGGGAIRSISSDSVVSSST
jgi:hypothetical protein